MLIKSHRRNWMVSVHLVGDEGPDSWLGDLEHFRQRFRNEAGLPHRAGRIANYEPHPPHPSPPEFSHRDATTIQFRRASRV